jgi:hypothetical protein
MRVAPLLAVTLMIASPASASTYEALCAATSCTISLDANGISSPSGFIPTARIAQWFTGGDEGYNAGKGTAGALGGATAGAIGGALLLGPIGLLGGLIGGGLAGSKAGKTADLFFNVVGYDQGGKKTTISFRFVNPKPANRLKMELPMFTGLAMGQTRSVDELRNAVAGGSQSVSTGALPETLTPESKPHQATDAKPHAAKPPTLLPESLKPEVVVVVETTNEEKWQAYLKERGLDQWASTNPKMAEQLKQRLYPSP